MISERKIKIGDNNFIFRLLRTADRDKLDLFFKQVSNDTKKVFSPRLLKYEIEDIIADKEEKKLKRLIILHNKEIISYFVIVLGLRKWEKIRYNLTKSITYSIILDPNPMP